MAEFIWQTVSKKNSANRKKPESNKSEAVQDGFERTVTLPASCTGIAIGKKGENLKAIQQTYKVEVSVGRAAEGADVDVAVRGPSQRDVVAAAQELEYMHECVDISPGMAGWVCGKAGKHLQAIKDLTGLVVLSCEGGRPSQRPAKSSIEAAAATTAADDIAPSVDAGVDAGRCWLELKGKAGCVHDAQMCIDAHLSYHPVFVEMREHERQLDEQIAKLRNGPGKLGRRAGVPRQSLQAQGQPARAKAQTQDVQGGRPRSVQRVRASKKVGG